MEKPLSYFERFFLLYSPEIPIKISHIDTLFDVT